MSHNLSTEKVGSRIYVMGNTYPVRERLKRAGCHWDGDRQQWWIGAAKAAAIEAIVGKLDQQLGGEYSICPPKKHNDLVRSHGGVWDGERKAWLLPSADKLAALQAAIAPHHGARKERYDQTKRR